MRKRLAEKGERKKFRGIFNRFGKKMNYQGFSERTVLLTTIIDEETLTVVTDHVWFNFTKGFENIGLQPGQQLQFEARIKLYKKGYVNKKYKIDNSSMDYKLSHPTRIKVLKSDGSM